MKSFSISLLQESILFFPRKELAKVSISSPEEGDADKSYIATLQTNNKSTQTKLLRTINDFIVAVSRLKRRYHITAEILSDNKFRLITRGNEAAQALYDVLCNVFGNASRESMLSVATFLEILEAPEHAMRLVIV